MSLTLLCLQLTVILVTARACGLALRAVGQPMVIGEMAAGILLGPVVFGASSRSGMHNSSRQNALSKPFGSLFYLRLLRFYFINDCSTFF